MTSHRCRALWLLIAILLSGPVHAQIRAIDFGSDDPASARAIERINRLHELREKAAWPELEQALVAMGRTFQANGYAMVRIRNELADVYSYNLLDIESAIETDSALVLQLEHSGTSASPIAVSDDQPMYLPRSRVASRRTVARPNLLAEFQTKSSAEILREAKARLQRNRHLLAGQTPSAERTFTRSFLVDALQQVAADVASTHESTPERRALHSRAIRIEYELAKIDPSYMLGVYRVFDSRELTPSDVNLSEIDHLGLTRYLLMAARQTGRAEHAEAALEVIYRPYSKIRDPGSRWRYNNIINQVIAQIATLSFRAQRHLDLLYYLSLNKSRLLLEERLALLAGAGGSQSISTLAALDGIPRTASGLPDKRWFADQLSQLDRVLDLHVVSSMSKSDSDHRPSKASPRTAAPSDLLATRNLMMIGQPANEESEEVQVDEALYVTRADRGVVVSAAVVEGADLAKLRSQAERLYETVSTRNSTAPAVPELFRLLRATLGPSEQRPVVSPDKWLAKLPFDFMLDRPTVRVVNLFMAAPVQALKTTRVAGYFNPTLDLKGSELEAGSIRSAFPDAQTFVREEARLEALDRARDADILHLSMHGLFDSQDPRRSGLYFAGAATRQVRRDDAAVLYAKDMATHPALQKKSLIFAAACQTGLSTSQVANDAELLGILRPLTAAGNRNVILSLWNVDDAASQIFVDAFYRHLATSGNVAESFAFAQHNLRMTHQNPYFWSAFYLSSSR